MNTNFFETENIINCYYAGFIAADGNIKKNKNEISIKILKKDEKILYDFKKIIDTPNKIRESFCVKSHMSALSITNKKIKEDLLNIFNITPKKSLTLMPPNIFNIDNIKSFITGYIDGDGCIGYYFKKNANRMVLSFTIVGTFEIVSWINSIFEENINLNFDKSISKRKEHKHNTYILSVTDAKAIAVWKFLYNKDLPRFERKWNNEIINYVTNHIPKKRKILKLDKISLKVIDKYDSVTEAANSVMTRASNISKCCNNINYSVKNYKWKYDEN